MDYTTCVCGTTWYQGDSCNKKLTWAGKYYCKSCHHIANDEKITLLRVVPYEVLKLMIDREELCTSRVSKFVWGF